MSKKQFVSSVSIFGSGECRECNMRMSDNIELHKIIDELEQQLADAEKVIEFYGDRKNWDLDQLLVNDHDNDESRDFKDYSNGRTARNYLAKYKGGGDE